MVDIFIPHPLPAVHTYYNIKIIKSQVLGCHSFMPPAHIVRLEPLDGFEPPYEPYEDPVLPLYDGGKKMLYS